MSTVFIPGFGMGEPAFLAAEHIGHVPTQEIRGIRALRVLWALVAEGTVDYVPAFCLVFGEEVFSAMGGICGSRLYITMMPAQIPYDHLFVKTGALDTNRQAKLVRPLALGLLDGEEKAKAQQRLVKAVTDYHYHVGTGFLSTPFLLGVLTEAGEGEVAYKMLENTEKPGWLYEVCQGANTIWETWEGNASHNHYSPGAVCQWLFDTVAGIRPDGENHFVIQPVPGGTLTHAKACYRSIYGLVESGWERKGNSTVYTVTIPANTTSQLHLPDGSSHSLTAGTHTYTL